MNFEVRNKIMVLVNDNITAYGIAQEFIKDDEQKYVVFERCFNRAEYDINSINGEAKDEAKASQAKDRSNQLWKEYEAA